MIQKKLLMLAPFKKNTVIRIVIVQCRNLGQVFTIYEAELCGIRAVFRKLKMTILDMRTRIREKSIT